MVANSFWGFLNIKTTAFKLLDFDFEALSISIFDKEKKATSAPETRAESASKNSNAIMPNSKL